MTLAVRFFGALWVFAAVTLVRNFHHTKAYGWTLSVERESWRFVAVDPTGPDAGRLKPGDRLLSLNGDPRAAVLGALLFVNAPIEGVYRVEIDRYRQRKAYDMLMPAGPRRQLWLVFLTVSLAFFACGAALDRLRPQDAHVRLILRQGKPAEPASLDRSVVWIVAGASSR